MLPSTISFDIFHPEPLLVVVSGPSGVGKDAVLKALRERRRPFHFVVTVTSRPPRPGEVEGKDYFFVSKERFEEMIEGGELIEYAHVYTDYKGIPKSQIRSSLESGKDVILRLDVQGATKIRELCPEAVLIFLIPANGEEWYQRLRGRKSETPETLQVRLEAAQRELKSLPIFDYIVVNAQDQLEEAVDTIEAIIEAEHHRVVPRKITL